MVLRPHLLKRQKQTCLLGVQFPAVTRQPSLHPTAETCNLRTFPLIPPGFTQAISEITRFAPHLQSVSNVLKEQTTMAAHARSHVPSLGRWVWDYETMRNWNQHDIISHVSMTSSEFTICVWCSWILSFLIPFHLVTSPTQYEYLVQLAKLCTYDWYILKKYVIYIIYQTLSNISLTYFYAIW